MLKINQPWPLLSRQPWYSHQYHLSIQNIHEFCGLPYSLYLCFSWDSFHQLGHLSHPCFDMLFLTAAWHCEWQYLLKWRVETWEFPEMISDSTITLHLGYTTLNRNLGLAITSALPMGLPPWFSRIQIDCSGELCTERCWCRSVEKRQSSFQTNNQTPNSNYSMINITCHIRTCIWNLNLMDPVLGVLYICVGNQMSFLSPSLQNSMTLYNNSDK